MSTAGAGGFSQTSSDGTIEHRADVCAGRSGAGLVFLGLLALGIGIAALTGYPGGMPSADAAVRTGIGKDLLLGLDRGRQGLVGSLRWAPLPTLAALPFLSVPGWDVGPFAMCIVAACAYALLGAFFNAWWAARGIGAAVRLPAVTALVLWPDVRLQIASGSSTSLFVVLAVMDLCFFLDWWEHDDLRSLAYLSIVTGLGVLTRWQYVLIFVGILGAVFIHVLLRHPRRRLRAYAEGTLVLYAMPFLYLAAVWSVANWLIMGDPTFFLRGLFWRGAGAGSLVNDACRGSACLAPSGVALAGYLGAKVFPRKRLLAGLPALGVAFLVLATSPARPERTFAEADSVARLLEGLRSTDRVAMSGHAAYLVRECATPRVRTMFGNVNRWETHTLSFYPAEALRNTAGRRLFIVVPPETSEYRWEDLLLKYPRIGRAAPVFVVYEGGIAGWRLMGVARPDEPASAAP